MPRDELMNIPIEEHNLLAQNISRLNYDDVAVVSYLGSGSSLLGSMLLSLNIDYVEGYQEEIIPGQKQTVVKIPYWRDNWAQLAHKYELYNLGDNTLRVMKAHYYPDSFKESKLNKAILLVRDARDAVISYYHWRKGFSDEMGSLHDFLARDGFYNKKPFQDWADYARSWVEWGARHSLHIVRYEDLKFSPVETLRSLLLFLGQARSNQEILESIKTSSFAALSNTERKTLKVSDAPQIFRKGQVGEWLAVLDKAALANVTEDTLHWLDQLGYVAAPCTQDTGVLSIIGLQDLTASFIDKVASTYKDIQIFDDSTVSPADLDNIMFLENSIGFPKAKIVSDYIKEKWSDAQIKVFSKHFLVEDMDSLLSGDTVNLTSNPEIEKSVSARCAYNGWNYIGGSSHEER